MDNKVLNPIEESFFEGAYSLTYDLSTEAIKTGSIGNIAYLYRSIAEIGMSDITTISLTTVKSNISFAFGQLIKDCTSIERAEELFDDSLTMCISVAKTLEANFKTLDEELSQQYQGSAGISFESDDPAERAEEKRQEAFNYNINTQRHNLKEKYEDIVKALFETTLITILQTNIIRENKHMVSLNFIDHIKNVIHSVDNTTANAVKSFITEVKKARNEHYWKENAELYKSLTFEKSQREENISQILKNQLERTEKEMTKAIEAKEAATKERRRYSLFNSKDRKPQSKIISEAKKTIKQCKEKEKQLKAGKCELCEADRKRISAIETELTIQR